MPLPRRNRAGATGAVDTPGGPVVPPPGDWFVARVTSTSGTGPVGYVFEEWWTDGNGAWQKKTGGRGNGVLDLAHTLPASDLSEVVMAVNNFALCRAAPGAGGALWELLAVAPSVAAGGTVTSWKHYVRVATTAAGTLASSFENGDTVDGVVLATGDRILVKNQAAPSANGIYVVAASGAPTRATDADAWAELVNATVAVSVGTVNADTIWMCTADAGGTLNTTALPWVKIYPHKHYAITQLTGSGTYTVPTRVTQLIVECVGGGGGGAGVANNATLSAAGAGGGGGGYARRLYNVSPGDTFAYTVGAGGAGGTAAANTGNPGTSSTFDTGGGAETQGGGGSGGTALTVNNFAAFTATTPGGGADGEAEMIGGHGSPGYRWSATDLHAGMGGVGGGGFGYGGAGVSLSTAGVGFTGIVGSGFGGGGSGACSAQEAGTGRSGGAGSAGTIVVTEYY